MTLHQIWPLTFPVLQVCLVPMWAEPVALFNMFLPHNPHLSHWLATFLLLNCWKAGGAHNGSEVVTSMQRASIPPIVVKEGSSMLITCNVTGTYDNISWYNSKGPLQGDDAGRTRKWSSKILISFEFFSSCMAFFFYLKAIKWTEKHTFRVSARADISVAFNSESDKKVLCKVRHISTAFQPAYQSLSQSLLLFLPWIIL